MFGASYIAVMNDAATLQALCEENEDALYIADDIAAEVAYEAGWRQDDYGVWIDDEGEKAEQPLDDLYNGWGHLPADMREEILNRTIRALREEA